MYEIKCPSRGFVTKQRFAAQYIAQFYLQFTKI